MVSCSGRICKGCSCVDCTRSALAALQFLAHMTRRRSVAAEHFKQQHSSRHPAASPGNAGPGPLCALDEDGQDLPRSREVLNELLLRVLCPACALRQCLHLCDLDWSRRPLFRLCSDSLVTYFRSWSADAPCFFRGQQNTMLSALMSAALADMFNRQMHMQINDCPRENRHVCVYLAAHTCVSGASGGCCRKQA